MDDGLEKLDTFFQEAGLAHPQRPPSRPESTGRRGRRGLWLMVGFGVLASYLWTFMA
jgi:hypothetical protein